MRTLRFVVCALGCLALAACNPDRDGGGGTTTVDGPVSIGDLAMVDSAQPAGWAAPITADVWHVDLTAGAPVTILLCSTMPSSGFDPFLLLDFMGNQVAMDDDSAGNLNARIIYAPTETGTYSLYVTSWGGTAPPSSSAYTLHVMSGQMFGVTCPAAGSP